MSDEKKLDLGQFAGLAELIEARLRRGQGSGSGRRAGGFRVDPDPAASSAPETWQDGTPKDPEAAILARFDEERYSADSEYQSRPEVQKDAERLVTIRAAKRRTAPHPEIVGGEGVPTQAEYEKDGAALLRAERRKQIEEQIAEARARLDALEGDE